MASLNAQSSLQARRKQNLINGGIDAWSTITQARIFQQFWVTVATSLEVNVQYWFQIQIWTSKQFAEIASEHMADTVVTAYRLAGQTQSSLACMLSCFYLGTAEQAVQGPAGV